MTQEEALKQRELQNQLRKELGMESIEEAYAKYQEAYKILNALNAEEKKLFEQKAEIEEKIKAFAQVKEIMGITPNIPLKLPILTKRGLKKD